MKSIVRNGIRSEDLQQVFVTYHKSRIPAANHTAVTEQSRHKRRVKALYSHAVAAYKRQRRGYSLSDADRDLLQKWPEIQTQYLEIRKMAVACDHKPTYDHRDP